jgi:16S rRNA (guanine527-N7)-methyltransferase
VGDQKTLLTKGLKKLNLDLAPHQEEQLKKFLQSVLKENKKFNLTGIKDPKEAIVKHLFDSLSVASEISAASVADIGSGAGFPGIPLAIVKPGTSFVLVEAKQKKARFIKKATKELGLLNVVVFGKRSEEIKIKKGVEAIICRAIGSLDYFVEKTKHLLSQGGSLYAMKGRLTDDEIKKLPKDWHVAQIKKIDVPYLEAERHLVKILKKNKK